MSTPPARGGQILLLSAALCAAGILPVAGPTRGILGVSGLVEAFIGLRFLEES